MTSLTSYGPPGLLCLIAADGAAAGEVEPAVVQQDAGGQLVFEDDLGLVVDALALACRAAP